MTDKLPDLDVGNYAAVSIGSHGQIAILNPPHHSLDRNDALILAAWIVALADPLNERFPDILDKVRST